MEDNSSWGGLSRAIWRASPKSASAQRLKTFRARFPRRQIIALALCLALAGCSLDALLPATATPTPTVTPTWTPSNTPPPTPTPSATATFTATATATATATYTASATPSATPTVYAIVRSRQRVNVRGGPGTQFAAIGSLASASGVPVIGQNDDGDWVQVRLDDGEDGWVSAALLQIEAPPTAESPVGETERLSEETRIVVELAEDGDSEGGDGLRIINVPVADVAGMQLTATVLVGAGLTATADALPTSTPEPARSPTPTAARPTAPPRFDVKIFAFCNDPAFGIAAPADLTAGSTIQIFWAWFASSDAYLRQHISNAAHELRVNGAPIADVDQYRLDPSRSGNQHVVYWYVPYGPLDAGPHVITYRVTWRNPISDGYADYGPGAANEFEEESCSFTVS